MDNEGQRTNREKETKRKRENTQSRILYFLYFVYLKDFGSTDKTGERRRESRSKNASRNERTDKRDHFHDLKVIEETILTERGNTGHSNGGISRCVDNGHGPCVAHYRRSDEPGHHQVSTRCHSNRKEGSFGDGLLRILPFCVGVCRVS